MADAEEPQFNTLKERIAALNQQKNFSSTGTNPDGSRRRAPPPPPPGAAARPVGDGRSQTAPVVPQSVSSPVPSVNPAVPPRPSKAAPPPLPRRDTSTSQTEVVPQSRAAPPPLPSRTPSNQSSPAFPPRRVSTQSSYLGTRRGSVSSEISQLSAVSSLSIGRSASPATTPGIESGPRKMMVPAFGTTALPKLPPSRREMEAQAQAQAQGAAAAKETSRQRPPIPSPQLSYNGRKTPEPPKAPAAIMPARPSLPPRLPSRPVKSTNSPAPTAREIPPHLKKPLVGFNNKPQERPAPEPTPDSSPQMEHAQPDDAPPPVPVSSRPSMAQIEATSTRVVAPPLPNDGCWICRDWSGPDQLATQFPRDSLPRQDPVGHLARGLCDPFPSYDDKARAIFTWFHHNIFYDTVAFFGNNVKHMSVEDTIFSGKAVCQGYAETYKAIANRAGLDCVTVVGHGKGFGHTALKKGERPPPPKPDGHAWNAVRVDGGVWKLLDACWGAGHLDTGTNSYKQKFSPGQFTKSNEVFGQRHFPREGKYQFRDDGRTIGWDEYFIGRVNGETPIFYGNGHVEGIAEDSVEPMERQVSVNSGEVVRFQFCKICPHWQSEKHGEGKPPLLLLSIHGVDGRKDDMIPIETDGYWHWVDVNAKDLGAPGQAVQVASLTKIDGRDGRGVTAKEFLSKRGKVGMAWAYVLKWDLVR